MRRQPGSLEDAIIAVLGRTAAMSVAEVRAELGGDLAHTTVMTALVRLTDKQLVTRTKTGRAYAYSLAVPARDLPALRAAIKMRNELQREGHPTVPTCWPTSSPHWTRLTRLYFENCCPTTTPLHRDALGDAGCAMARWRAC